MTSYGLNNYVRKIIFKHVPFSVAISNRAKNQLFRDALFNILGETVPEIRNFEVLTKGAIFIPSSI